MEQDDKRLGERGEGDRLIWTREIKVAVVGVGEAVLLSEVQVRKRTVTSGLVNYLMFCRRSSTAWDNSSHCLKATLFSF